MNSICHIEIANLVAALLHENVQYLEDRFFIALKEIVVLSDLTRRHLMTTIAPKNETRFLSEYNECARETIKDFFFSSLLYFTFFATRFSYSKFMGLRKR